MPCLEYYNEHRSSKSHLYSVTQCQVFHHHSRSQPPFIGGRGEAGRRKRLWAANRGIPLVRSSHAEYEGWCFKFDHCPRRKSIPGRYTVQKDRDWTSEAAYAGSVSHAVLLERGCRARVVGRCFRPTGEFGAAYPGLHCKRGFETKRNEQTIPEVASMTGQTYEESM